MKTMTAREAADKIGVHPNTLKNWAAKGYGPTRTKIGGRIAYRADEVDSFIEKQFDDATSKES